jgi:hypothetical protein
MKKLMKAAQVMGLTVNMQKRKYMEVTKRPTNTKMLLIGNQQYGRMKEFKYLGTTLTEDNGISTEIKQRIIIASKTSCGLKKQLNSPYLKWQTKCVLHETLTDPYKYMEGKVGPSQRRMKIFSKSLKEKF